jgi:hypothetical protein
LGFADSLANQPYDDFFRFLFIYLWSRPQTPRGVIGILITALLGTLTSLDSLFFIPIFAVLYDALVRRQFRWKVWASLGLVLCLSFIIQFTQNALYMGLKTAIADWKGYYLHYGGKHNLDYRRAALEDLMTSTFSLSFTAIKWLLLAGLVAGFLLSKEIGMLTITMAFAGVAFPIMVAGKSTQAYEVRQLLPLACITWICLFQFLKKKLTIKPIPTTVFACIALVIVIGKPLNYQVSTLGKVKNLPPTEGSNVEFFQNIAKKYPVDKVYFQLGSNNIQNGISPDYGQINPYIEMVSEGLYLHFRTVELLTKDLKYIWAHRTNDFTPILIFNPPSQKDEEALKQELQEWRGPNTWEVIAQDAGIVAVTLKTRD